MSSFEKEFTIFVGSTMEARNVDTRIRAILERPEFNAVSVLPWSEICGPGDVFLDSLLRACDKVDAAILITSADDLLNTRGETLMSPRDNIILEIGICLASLGRESVAIAHIRGDDGYPKLPTDLEGLFTLRLDPDKPASFEIALSNWVSNLIKIEGSKEDDTHGIDLNNLTEHLKKIRPENKTLIDKYIIQSINHKIDLLGNKNIYLTQSEYYSELDRAIDRSNSDTEISAISTLSSSMWTEDPEQILYAENNIKAALRGAKIRRLFVCSDEDWGRIKPSIENQLEAGILINRATPMIHRDIHHLEDIVIFKNIKNGETRGFVAVKDPHSNKRLRYGQIILDIDEKRLTIDSFRNAWDLAEKIINTVSSPMPDETELGAPGLNLKEYFLESKVVSCEQAANAKNIPLNHELKTLILNTSRGNVALHLRGDKRASLRSVKNTLGVEEAYMLSIKELNELDMQPGTVSAVLDPVWSMPHLIARSVLSLEEVSTNSGKLNAYFRFPPSIMLNASSVTIGDFEEL